MQVVNDEVYNQLITMHGTIMLLLFASPLFIGFGNAMMPLQIGSPSGPGGPGRYECRAARELHPQLTD
jgi:hypothetical protein